MAARLSFLFTVCMMALLCAGPPARAGPWPREKGQTFVAIATEAAVDASSLRSSFYGERGLGNGWTLVVDGAHLPRSGGIEGRLALRRALPLGLAGHALSAEFGLGARLPVPGEPPVLHLRPGAAWGFGFSELLPGRDLPGWVSVEVAAELGRGPPLAKVDTTLGLRPHPRLTTILRLQADAAPGRGHNLYSAPSIVWRAREGFEMELGAVLPLGQPGPMRIKLASWISF